MNPLPSLDEDVGGDANDHHHGDVGGDGDDHCDIFSTHHHCTCIVAVGVSPSCSSRLLSVNFTRLLTLNCRAQLNAAWAGREGGCRPGSPLLFDLIVLLVLI